MGRWSARWRLVGVNEGGDPVYVRSNTGTASSATQGVELESLSKSELAALASEQGLSKSGTKQDLIDRLRG